MQDKHSINPARITVRIALVLCYLAPTLVLIGYAIPLMVSASDTLIVVTGFAMLLAWFLISVFIALAIFKKYQLNKRTKA